MLRLTPYGRPLQRRGIRLMSSLASAVTAAGLLLAATSLTAQTASPPGGDKPETLVFVRHGGSSPHGAVSAWFPYGVHARLRWADLQASPDLPPRVGAAEETVEWIVPMRH